MKNKSDTIIVSIQGARGSFHEAAAREYFGSKVALIYCENFNKVFLSLQNGITNTAVVAIGNSRYGDIDSVYTPIIRNHVHKENHRFWIKGEIYMQINHCLLGLPGSKLCDIVQVHSQAPALGQCKKYLDTYIPHAVAVEQDDTAKSAQLVSKWHDKTKAAIASHAAAEMYGLSVLAENIQDDKDNTTRFLVIGAEITTSPRNNKASLLLKTSNQPGALVHALNLFSQVGINLSYIQSIPIPEELFKYRFYIDIDAGVEDARVKTILTELINLHYETDVLGSYHAARLRSF
jgi:prephenate dehydratase